MIHNSLAIMNICIFVAKSATWFSENEGGGQRPFGTFPKIHLFWMCQASLNSDMVNDQNKLSKIRRCVSWVNSPTVSITSPTMTGDLVLHLVHLPVHHLATLVRHLATLVDEQQIPTEWLATLVDQHTPRNWKPKKNCDGPSYLST